MNPRSGAPRSRRRLGYLGVVALAAGCTVFLAVAGSASASSVRCGGTVKRAADAFAGPNSLDYTLKCNEPIQAFSVVTSKPIDYFQPDPTVFKPDGEVSETGHFNCEGFIPGPGFGCPGAMAAYNHVTGVMATREGPCRVPLLRAWAVVTTQQLDSHGNPFTTSSAPYRLAGPSCPTTSSARVRARAHRARARHHRHRHHRS